MTTSTSTTWTVAAVDHDGELVRVDLEHRSGERRHVEIAAGVLAVLGCLPRRHDGAPLPDTRLDEWGRPG